MRKHIVAGFVALVLAILGRAQNLVFEQFNAGIPGTWTVVDGGGSTHTWFGTTTGYNGNTLNGTQFAFVNSDAAGNTPHPLLSEQLISPTFNATAFSQLWLEWDQYYRLYSNDRGYVEVWNGSSWVTLLTLSANAGNWNAPDHPNLNITPYINAAMKVRFRYEDNNIWAWWWAVDNVRVYGTLSLDLELQGVTLPQGPCGLTATESVQVQGRNNGTSTITSVPLRYRLNGGPVVSETLNATVAPGATFSYTFTTPANLSAAGIHRVDVWANLAGDLFPANDSVMGSTIKNHIRISSFPYIEDFEASQGGWFVTGTSPSWAWGTPAKATIQGAASGAKAWVTGGLGVGSHANNEENQVEGPCLDFSNMGSPWIGLNTWWNAEQSWDGANVQTSIDSGATWVTVGQFGDPYNWYTDDAIDGGPGGSTEGWTGRAATGNGSNGWQRSLHSLAHVAGAQDVMLRVAFASDGSVVDDGFAFDNINIAPQPIMYLGPDTVVCDSLTLDAGPANEWNWSTGDLSQTITVMQTGDYTATVRDSFGFPASDVIHVTVEGPRTWDLGNDTVLCVANSLALAAGAGAQSYLWSNGATTPQIVATANGTYAVTATSAAGCARMDSISLIISDLEAGIAPSAGPICRGVPVIFQDLSNGSPSSWLWDFGNGNLSVNQNPTTVFPNGGTFTVELTVSDGSCTDDTTIQVLVDVCSGLASPGSPTLGIYPQPALGQLHLTGLAQLVEAVELRLLGIHGQIVWRERLEAGGKADDHLMDLGELPAGTYLLEVDFGSGLWSQRVMLLR